MAKSKKTEEVKVIDNSINKGININDLAEFTNARLKPTTYKSSSEEDSSKEKQTPNKNLPIGSENQPSEENLFLQTIDPPIQPEILLRLGLLSSSLRPCVQAIVESVYMKGYKLNPRISQEERDDDSIQVAMEEEKEKIEVFLKTIDIDGGNHIEFKEKSGANLEYTGNLYWEIIRENYSSDSKIYGLQLLESNDMRITPKNSDWVKWSRPVKVENGVWKREDFPRRFRLFVQKNRTNDVYFKELGDPRNIDRKTGKVIQQKEWEELSDVDKNKRAAHEILWHKKYYPLSSYGVPDYINVLYAVVGDILKDESNLLYFNNGSKADLIITSNKPLSKESVKKIEDAIHDSKSFDNSRKALVIITEADEMDILGDQNQTSIDVKEIGQRRDAQFIKYGEINYESIKSAFRLPDHFVGRTKDFNRSTAETAKTIADDLVFKPKREKFDYIMNDVLFPEMGFVYWKYESLSGTKDNIQILSDTLDKISDSGITLREARQIIGKTFEMEMSELKNIEPLLDVPLKLLDKGFDFFIGVPSSEEETVDESNDSNIEEFKRKNGN